MRLEHAWLIAPSLVATCVLHLLFEPTAAAQEGEVDWGFEGGDGETEDASAGPQELDLRVRQPPRVLVRLGGGVGVRLGTEEQFNQDTLAPVYLELMGGYVFGGSGRWRHGVTLNVQSNLTSDGSAAEEIDLFNQYTFIASYLAYFRYGMDFVLGARLGPAYSLALVSTPGDTRTDWSWGGEVAVHAQYMLLAGFGVYVDLGVSIFAGGNDTVHPIAAASGGLLIDYELLP